MTSPCPCAEYLHFQMARAFNVFFDKHARIAKVILPQPLYGLKGVRQLAGVATDAHPDTAAPGGAF